ncbi:hypothetical protein R6Q59_004297 [Mikania micrantha]
MPELLGQWGLTSNDGTHVTNTYSLGDGAPVVTVRRFAAVSGWRATDHRRSDFSITSQFSSLTTVSLISSLVQFPDRLCGQINRSSHFSVSH